MTKPVLHCFRSSHFNEKAHWALDWKGIGYDVVEHWPGSHFPAIKRLSGGSQTPVLEIDGGVVAGSTAILEHLDARVPARPLFPADATERARCLEIIAWFDGELGPAVRRALFHGLLPDLDGLARVFVREPWGLRERLHRMALPVVAKVMRREMKIDAAGAEAGRKTTEEALERVAQAHENDGYLMGDSFTAADLTAAALLSITTFPPGFHAPLPEPEPASLVAWRHGWSGHPGVRWVEATYAKHRH